MKKKILSALLSTAMLAAVVAGCGSKPAEAPAEAPAEEAPAETPAEESGDDAEAEAPAEGGGRVFGYTCMDGTNPFFVALEGAIREVVEAHGDTLLSVDPGDRKSVV